MEEDDGAPVCGELGCGLDGPPDCVFGVLTLAHLVAWPRQGRSDERNFMCI